MAHNGNGQEDSNRSQMRPHEEFLELCAVSTTGELSEDEQQKLREHLGTCRECRQALTEFEATARVGVPLLSSELLKPRLHEQPPTPSNVLAAPSKMDGLKFDSTSTEKNEKFVFAHRNGYGHAEVNWNYIWIPFAAAVVLTATLGIYSYQVGRRRTVEVRETRPAVSGSKVDALEQQLSDASQEREVLKAQLAERNRMIRELQREVESQSTALTEAKSAQANLERSFQNEQTETKQVAPDDMSLREKLSAAQTSLEKVQADLDAVRRERDQDQLRAQSMEGQISDLYAQLTEKEQLVGKQQDLLADDRDIRDLMGARDLYIAEVYDVARDGTTRKPYGRIFYTKGKSLIFYAYDLDQQPGAKNASTFQAWGQNGPDREQVLSLGIFYQDSAAKKRWVLKVDDARTLGQINAVFVTVEPRGGSHTPSGKRLLFASLRIEPNHP